MHGPSGSDRSSGTRMSCGPFLFVDLAWVWEPNKCARGLPCWRQLIPGLLRPGTTRNCKQCPGRPVLAQEELKWWWVALADSGIQGKPRGLRLQMRSLTNRGRSAGGVRPTGVGQQSTVVFPVYGDAVVCTVQVRYARFKICTTLCVFLVNTQYYKVIKRFGGKRSLYN